MKIRGMKTVVSLLAAIALLMTTLVGAWASSPDAGRRIVINIPSRTLWLYEGDEIIKWFPVGVGRPGFSTPTGAFRVVRKILNPGWENPYKPSGASRIGPGANNPLGTRWIGFHPYKGGEYGIHGTNRPSSVGQFSSHGCVRMKIPDAEALFEMVDVGTPVEVRYDLAIIRKHDDRIRIATYRDAFRRGTPSAAEIRDRILERFPGAQVDEASIVAALRNPREQYVEVGRVIEDLPVVASTDNGVASGAMAGTSALPETDDKTMMPRYAMTQAAEPANTRMEVKTLPQDEGAVEEAQAPEAVIAPNAVPERWFVRPAWRRTYD